MIQGTQRTCFGGAALTILPDHSEACNTLRCCFLEPELEQVVAVNLDLAKHRAASRHVSKNHRCQAFATNNNADMHKNERKHRTTCVQRCAMLSSAEHICTSQNQNDNNSMINNTNDNNSNDDSDCDDARVTTKTKTTKWQQGRQRRPRRQRRQQQRQQLRRRRQR